MFLEALLLRAVHTGELLIQRLQVIKALEATGTSSQTTSNNGGSGIVVIRYADTYGLAASTTGSPTQVTSGGYHRYTWTGSGSVTF
jgi:hypothetical protein